MHAEQARTREAKHAAEQQAETAFPDRMVDHEWSKHWNIESEENLRSAHVLRDGKLWSHAVCHCQQAVEMGLKALLLDTCGATNEELRGRRAHQLTSLVDSCCARANANPCK